jgi:hypothetical protein
MKNNTAYLGDSVYVEVNLDALKLYTMNIKDQPKNVIFLEYSVLRNLILFAKKHRFINAE